MCIKPEGKQTAFPATNTHRGVFGGHVQGLTHAEVCLVAMSKGYSQLTLRKGVTEVSV